MRRREGGSVTRARKDGSVTCSWPFGRRDKVTFFRERTGTPRARAHESGNARFRPRGSAVALEMRPWSPDEAMSQAFGAAESQPHEADAPSNQLSHDDRGLADPAARASSKLCPTQPGRREGPLFWRHEEAAGSQATLQGITQQQQQSL